MIVCILHFIYDDALGWCSAVFAGQSNLNF